MKKIILIAFLSFIGQLQAQKSFGFVFTNTQEKLFISKVFTIGPAEKAGVKVDDLWLKINNIVLPGKTNQEIGNILAQLQQDEATFEFSRNRKIINLKFSRIEKDLFLERCISGDCINGNGIYRFENGKTIEGEFKNGKYIDPNKHQFATSHLQPNYIADQIDTSTINGKDAVRSQNGYDEYRDLRFEAMILTFGLGVTKEVNLKKALALSNEAIRIFPNLSRAYIDRALANYKLGNATAAQNDFDKARQLAPFDSSEIDKAQAKIEGREILINAQQIEDERILEEENSEKEVDPNDEIDRTINENYEKAKALHQTNPVEFHHYYNDSSGNRVYTD